MSETWNKLARDNGRKAVMSLAINDATLDRVTEEQCAVIGPLLRPLLPAGPGYALDYGCGAGRFCEFLHRLTGRGVMAYEPTNDLRDLVPYHPHIMPAKTLRYLKPANIFSVIFVAMVLGDPEIEIGQIADHIVSLLMPDGLLVVIDHMPDPLPVGRWWQYRPMAFYQDLFRLRGIGLDRLGEVDQVGNMVTILAGKRT